MAVLHACATARPVQRERADKVPSITHHTAHHPQIFRGAAGAATPAVAVVNAYLTVLARCDTPADSLAEYATLCQGDHTFAVPKHSSAAH